MYVMNDFALRNRANFLTFVEKSKTIVLCFGELHSHGSHCQELASQSIECYHFYIFRRKKVNNFITCSTCTRNSE